MMKYLSAKRSGNSTFPYRTLLVIYAALVVYFWPTVKAALLPVYDPLLTFTKISTLKAHSYLDERSSEWLTKNILIAKIANLEEENENLKAKLAYANAVISARIEASQAGLSTTSLQHELGIRASPLLARSAQLFSVFYLSKGYEDGIREGMFVFTNKRVAIGKVVMTRGQTASVELLSKSGEAYEALLFSSSTSSTSTEPVRMVISGNGGGSFVASVPKSIKIEIGDTVLLAAQETLKLGEVAGISNVKQDVAQRVFIRGGFSIGTLSSVYVK